MGSDQHPEIEWRDGVPVARAFGDPYYSLADGLAETRHVFLAGNDLPARFRPGFHIAELGFGTGLNAFAALAAWREHGYSGPLRFTSFERFPMSAAAMEKALSRWPEIAEVAAPFLHALAAGRLSVVTPGMHLRIVTGDARETLPAWPDAADAWFLDGFAPARNPELWEPGLLAAVARHTRPGGSAATYSAAGSVRRALAAAGFEVARAPGFGSKRHMTRARLP